MPDDEDVAGILAGCQADVARLQQDVGSADTDAVLENLYRLPSDLPATGALAASVLRLLVLNNPNADMHGLRHVDRLLAIADRNPPPHPSWRTLRASARMMAILRAAAEFDLPDPRAALAKLDAIAADAPDNPGLAMLHRSARSAVSYLVAMNEGDESGVRQMLSDIEGLRDGYAANPVLGANLDVLSLAGEVMTAHQGGGDVLTAVQRLRAATDKLPPGHRMHEVMAELDAMMGPFRDSLSGRSSGALPSTATEDQLAALRRLADTPATGGEQAFRQAATGGALAGNDAATPEQVEESIARFREALSKAGPGHPLRTFYLASVALGLVRRADVTGNLSGLDEALGLLDEARSLMGGPYHPQWTLVHEGISWIHHRRGGVAGSRDAVLDGLRSYAWRVLLQPDAAAARIAARDAARDAVSTARQCLTDNDGANAVRALDAGRGLILFAATELRDLATRLRDADRPELVERLRADGPYRGPDRLPPGLRQELLAALSDRAGTTAVFDPPTLPEIRTALSRLDVDALVYLVPGQPAGAGWAAMLPAQGPPSFMVLPSLIVGASDVESYLTAAADRGVSDQPAQESPAGSDGTRDLMIEARDTRFVDSLDGLCDWAWRAAIGPLVERYLPTLPVPDSERPPRVVLVPMGDLTQVPWQAARRPDGTYAVRLAAFSQAVSARMLCDSAALAPVPVTPVGLVVGNPDTGSADGALPAAGVEAYAIRQAFYLGARYVGRRADGSPSLSGAGTAAEVRNWLTTTGPGAGAVLHLACHGVLTGSPDARASYLLLAGGEPLSAETLIDLMAGAPERAIGLVVLAACNTGRSIHGYDEAYSLGTAFLAGRVRSVLSTQWSIPDRETSVLMFMFHHHLMVDRLPVWAALYQAQLWMLDPDRVVPDQMPPALRRQLAQTDPARVVAWAGFVHWGQ